MTKAMAIQLIRYYVDEFLPEFTSMCLPSIFEERSYKRSAALELAEFIRDGEGDPYLGASIFRQKNALKRRRVKNKYGADQLYRAYDCNVKVAKDILEIMEAMEDEYENEGMGFSVY